MRSHRASVLAAAAVLVTLMFTGCGAGDGDSVIVEETGSLDRGDAQDMMHSGLVFDPFVINAASMDMVHAEVKADGFTPMLKLVEVSTSAVLAEWDSEFPVSEHLAYTVPVAGQYEVRVYSLSGTGTYELKVWLTD